MKTNLEQKGVSQILGLVLLVVFAVVGFVGYRVMMAEDEASNQANSSSAVVPENITTASDLEQAKEALEQTNLDSELDPSQFDDDVQDLL